MDSSIRRIANKCSNGVAFAQVVNDSTRRLLRRGDWENVDIPVPISVGATMEISDLGPGNEWAELNAILTSGTLSFTWVIFNV